MAAKKTLKKAPKKFLSLDQKLANEKKPRPRNAKQARQLEAGPKGERDKILKVLRAAKKVLSPDGLYDIARGIKLLAPRDRALYEALRDAYQSVPEDDPRDLS